MKKLLLSLFAVLVTATLASAQTAVTQTTLSSAMGTTNGTLAVVASATGMSASTNSATNWIYVDQEAMLITAISSTNLTVVRGVGGTRAATHASGATVYYGPAAGTAGSPFYTYDPTGSCTLANDPYTFRINVLDGFFFTCSTQGWKTLGEIAGFFSGQTAGTTVTTLNAGQWGSVILFDAASGNNFKLPVPQPGMTFDFIQKTTVTSNNAEIQTDGASTFIQGLVHVGIAGGATGSDWQCNGTSHVALKMNGTTSGGILGGRLHFVAISTTLWQVDGLIVGSGTEVTPCTATP